jgi:hypothetical protein
VADPKQPEDISPAAKLWQYARDLLKLGGDAIQRETHSADGREITNPCCGPKVHIAYRGKSDDRLYLAENRKWEEVRYFKPNGLRVFCAGCRRRLL